MQFTTHIPVRVHRNPAVFPGSLVFQSERKHMVFPQPFLHLTLACVVDNKKILVVFYHRCWVNNVSKRFWCIMCPVTTVFRLWLVTASKVAAWNRCRDVTGMWAKQSATQHEILFIAKAVWGNCLFVALDDFLMVFTAYENTIELSEPGEVEKETVGLSEWFPWPSTRSIFSDFMFFFLWN